MTAHSVSCCASILCSLLTRSQWNGIGPSSLGALDSAPASLPCVQLKRCNKYASPYSVLPNLRCLSDAVSCSCTQLGVPFSVSAGPFLEPSSAPALVIEGVRGGAAFRIVAPEWWIDIVAPTPPSPSS